MSDSMRHRDRCQQCGQWREDCGQEQTCRACLLGAERDRLRQEIEGAGGWREVAKGLREQVHAVKQHSIAAETECARLREERDEARRERDLEQECRHAATQERDRLREELAAAQRDCNEWVDWCRKSETERDRLRGELDAVSVQRDAADKAELEVRAQCARLREELAERERVARRIFSLITHCGLTIENAPEWLKKQRESRLSEERG